MNYQKSTKNTLVKTGVAITALAAIILPTITQAATLTRYLQVGSRGSDVSSVQTFLAGDATLYPQGLVTDYYGFLTKSAVSNFQVRNGIDPVGRIGPATLPVINAQMASGMNNNGADKRAPTINPISVNVSSSAAIFSFTTDEAAGALVYYSVYPITFTEASENSQITISGTGAIANLDLQTMHTANVTGLQPNTTYNYVVYVRDGLGNETISYPSTFRTSN